MADDKNGREKQARDADRRQRERDVLAALERGDETQPPVEEAVLDDIESELDALDFPATGSEVVNTVGDRTVDSAVGTYTLSDLVVDGEAETFESPAALRVRVQRPTIAAAMKRILEASETVPNADLRGSQREAYEKTLRELKAIDSVDDDEGIEVIADWIVDRIHENEKLPGSRAVRRQAAKFCRASGYQVRNDEWLGV